MSNVFAVYVIVSADHDTEVGSTQSSPACSHPEAD